jgi:hypothetical protein
LSDFDIVSKVDWKGEEGLGQSKRLPQHNSINVLCSSCPWYFHSQFFSEAMRFKAASFSVLVLNAKWGEIKAKATGSTATCEFKRIILL